MIFLSKMGIPEVMYSRAALNHSSLWGTSNIYRRIRIFYVGSFSSQNVPQTFRPRASSSSSSSSSSSQGFKSQPTKKSKKTKNNSTSDKKQEVNQTEDIVRGPNDDTPAPNLSLASNMQKKDEESLSFEERLEAIKRTAQERKRLEEEKMYGPIDYDAPVSKTDTGNVSFPVKVGIGIGVVVFGLVFAFGDFLPSQEFSAQKPNANTTMELNKEQVAKLKEQLQGFEAILKLHPDDLEAIEGAAVTYAELGDFSKAETELESLLQKKPMDVEALRLLAEVQSALGKYDKSTATYQQALKVSPRSIILLKGLVEALVSEGKQKEAVEELIAERENIYKDLASDNKKEGDDKATEVQISLLLGKTYSEWGHIGDALSVYDSVIKTHPEEFQGYLAKGILLKEQGQRGEADRMFIQARYFAPEKFKLLVDRYAK